MLNRPGRTRAVRLAVAAAVTALAVAVAGCDSGGSKDDGAAGEKGGPSVIAPGGPGEAARTLSAGEAAKAGDDDSPNSADLSYVRNMIEHHRQALVMTALAPDRVKSGAVKRLAERISAGQGPEIQSMEGWLTTHGGKGAGGAHDHAAMPGMATGKQLDALRAAHGADFDALFLKLMIAHHKGAISMATDVLSSGNNVRVEEMANDVIAQQSSEIRRMRELS